MHAGSPDSLTIKTKSSLQIVSSAGIPCPESGTNYYGTWEQGVKDEDGNIVQVSHPNARYTIRIRDLQNIDPNLNNPDGVKIDGIFYGGRDSDTNVPVYESLSWEHGVFIGASIESGEHV